MSETELPARPTMYWDPNSPIFYDEKTDTWNVFSLDDVLRVNFDTTAFTSSYGITDEQFPHVHPALIGMWVSDGKRHADLRAAAADPFRRRVLNELAPRIREIVDTLLDDLIARGDGRLEVVTELARPVTLRTICLILGLDMSHAALFETWVNRVSAAEATNTIPPDPEEAAFFAELIKERRKNPRTGLVDELIAAQRSGYIVDDRPMTEWDLIGYFAMLLQAGFNTTAIGITNAILFLTEYGFLDDLREDKELIPSAVEEVLRWYPPSPGRRRRVRIDTRIGEHKLQAGSWVVGWTTAANRDSVRFPRPHEFDIRRSPNRHLSFGHGPLHCLGAPLARLEMATVLEAVVERLPGLRRDKEVPLTRTYGVNDPLIELRCIFDTEASS